MISNKEVYDDLGYVINRKLIDEEKIKHMNDIIDKLSQELEISESVFDESGTGNWFSIYS